MNSLVSFFQVKTQRRLAAQGGMFCLLSSEWLLGWQRVEYWNTLVFLDHMVSLQWEGGEPLGLALRVETLSRPCQGRAGGWEGLSGDQKGLFKNAAYYTGKVVVFGHLGPVLE